MDTIHATSPPTTLTRHRLLTAATSADLTRRHVGHARPLYVGNLELPLTAVFEATELDRHGVWLWVLLAPGVEFACPTSVGHALLAEWDRELFGATA